MTRRNTPVSVLRYGGGAGTQGPASRTMLPIVTCALTVDTHRRGSPELSVCVSLSLSRFRTITRHTESNYL